MPALLNELPDLELLALSHNRIADLGGGALRALRGLRVLDLSHNQIAASELAATSPDAASDTCCF